MLLRADAGALPLADSSVDAIVTDPPYGLSAEPNIREVLTHWLAGDDYQHRSRGFMGRSWDSFVPGPATWREAYRVLKPGGHLIAMAGTRTVDLLMIALRLAGFEIRDTFKHFGAAPAAWVHGQGFPKSLDVSKAIDKAAGAKREVVGVRPDFAAKANRERVGVSWADRAVADGSFSHPETVGQITAPVTPDAKRWQGWGTALKPAHEPIVLARKPLSAGTVAANVLAYGTGAINVDACRVAHDGRGVWGNHGQHPENHLTEPGSGGTTMGTGWYRPGSERNPGGRWPSNTLLSHSPGCVQTGTRRIKGSNPGTYRRSAEESTAHPYEGGWKPAETGHRVDFYNDPDGTEETAAWACQPGCPVAEMDHQSGTSKSPDTYTRSTVVENHVFGASNDRPVQYGHGDKGGASRFFPQFAHDPDLDDVAPFRYVAKASSRERSAGLPDGRRNRHETVKPVALMRWLVRLVTPPGGGIVLDPFCGSGSTGVAAALEGFRFVGLDLEAEYLDVARARIAHAIQTPEQPALFA